MVARAGSRAVPARRTGRRRARVWAVCAAIVVGVVGAHWLHAWWASPEHRLAQFAAASQRGDLGSMIRLADEPEIRRARLNDRKLHSMLGQLGAGHGPVTFTDIAPEPLNSSQAAYNYMVTVAVRTGTGVPVLSLDGRPVRAYLYAYNTDRGWKVALTHALMSTTVARGAQGVGPYVRMCQAVGAAPGYLEPTIGAWRDLTPGPRQ